jgi:hypothetical protein
LDGLFHQKVVVCESDSDCRFYAALLDAIYEAKPDEMKPDVMFIHCGGKARIPSVIRSLRALGVITACVTDFDVLNDENPLREMFEHLGGLWSVLERDWKLVKKVIEDKKPELNADDVRQQIHQILDGLKDGQIPKAISQKIQKILKRSSPWAHAKEVGKSFVPSGDATQACERLLKNCRQAGLFIVEVGELEGFVKSVGNHGPAWVNAVMVKKLATDTELESARKFVMQVGGFALTKQ